jgi:hypothetical protein
LPPGHYCTIDARASLIDDLPALGCGDGCDLPGIIHVRTRQVDGRSPLVDVGSPLVDVGSSLVDVASSLVDVGSPELDVNRPLLHLGSSSHADRGTSLDEPSQALDDKGKGLAFGSRGHDVFVPGHAHCRRSSAVGSGDDDVY